ncbi:hypothetical protein [Roseateles asaccharophilus]|uniref:hypothetical protein n=1 Tax=Roseateles asaccharophilus TaxID=582607 RepID=UPI003919A5EA
MQHSITLNVPLESPPSDWEAIAKVYATLPGWLPAEEWPSWFGPQGGSNYITVSAEPSGLLFSGEVDRELWTGWISLLCARLSLALGREVCDACM